MRPARVVHVMAHTVELIKAVLSLPEDATVDGTAPVSLLAREMTRGMTRSEVQTVLVATLAVLNGTNGRLVLADQKAIVAELDGWADHVG